VLDGVVGHHHPPAPLLPGKRSGTHRTRGCVDHRAGLDGCRKSSLPLGFDLRTV